MGEIGPSPTSGRVAEMVWFELGIDLGGQFSKRSFSFCTLFQRGVWDTRARPVRARAMSGRGG